VLTTGQKASRLRMTVDRSTIRANGEDLSYITVEAVDANGQVDFTADQEVDFAITGPGIIAAVGNGDAEDPDSYNATKRKLYQGRAQVIVRSSSHAGRITVDAKSSNLAKDSVAIIVNSIAQQSALE
jgi:beta-galactosidase